MADIDYVDKYNSQRDREFVSIICRTKLLEMSDKQGEEING